MSADEVATLPERFARHPDSLFIVAPDILGISRNAAIYRRKGIARAETQGLAGREIAFLPAAAIGKHQAVKAAGGTVRVTAGAEDGRVRIRVRDTGAGIPADRLESIFEPFVQLDRNLTSAHQGTGLGLAISRDLARAMGGDLAAESMPGAGSVFTLSLPRAEADRE